MDEDTIDRIAQLERQMMALINHLGQEAPSDEYARILSRVSTRAVVRMDGISFFERYIQRRWDLDYARMGSKSMGDTNGDAL